MPIYAYTCISCGNRVDQFRARIEDGHPKSMTQCPECGDIAELVISHFAIGNAVHVGPGRAAYPTTWQDVHGGDPDVLQYWRRRIEREMREEGRDPELITRRESVASAQFNENRARRRREEPRTAQAPPDHRDWKSIPFIRPVSETEAQPSNTNPMTGGQP